MAQQKLTDRQLIGDLKAGRFKPVYLLTGEENYYIDVVSDYFENEVVDKDFRDFDQTVVYGSEVNMPTVLAYAKQYPMMSPVKLVLVKEAQNIDAKEWELLPAYLEHPLPQTLLVFCFRHKTLNGNSRAYKAIKANGVVFETKKMYDDKLPDWIGTYVNDHGHTITQKGAAILSEYLGNDLSRIANELSKVFIMLQPGEAIDDEVIERYIGISKDYNVFELEGAIARRDVAKCTRILNHFAANPKDNPIQMIVPTLYGFFVKVMIYHQVPPDVDHASAMKVSPFFLKDYAAAAQNYSLGKLASCIGYLYDADLRSKGVGSSGMLPDSELLKELIFKIIH